MTEENYIMTPNTYQRLASRTMPTTDPLKAGLHGVLGLQDEICEFINAAENLEEIEWRKNYIECDIWEDLKASAEEHALKELGDIWWMIAEIAQANELDLEEILNEPAPTNVSYVKTAQKLAGVYQKFFQGHALDPKKIKTLLSIIANHLKLVTESYAPIETVWEMNIKKLQDRYPEGFDPERSLHRKPDDV